LVGAVLAHAEDLGDLNASKELPSGHVRSIREVAEAGAARCEPSLAEPWYSGPLLFPGRQE
jgi:hypothetical protein